MATPGGLGASTRDATWLDYLRVRDRMTVAGREVEDKILGCHRGEGPPPTRYQLAHVPAAGHREEAPNASDPQAGTYDPGLPPGPSAKRPI